MKTIFKFVLLVGGALAVSFCANAANLNYNYAQLAITRGAQGPNFGSGLQADASYGITGNIYVVGNYASYAIVGSSNDLNDLSVGAGYHKSMGNWDLLGELRYRSLTVTGGGNSFTGYELNAGARVPVTRKMELRGIFGLLSLDFPGGNRIGPIVDVSGVYRIKPRLSVYAGHYDDTETFVWGANRIGLQYDF